LSNEDEGCTAKAIGLTISEILFVHADEAIECGSLTAGWGHARRFDDVDVVAASPRTTDIPVRGQHPNCGSDCGHLHGHKFIAAMDGW
jgi:hypothetical protein